MTEISKLFIYLKDSYIYLSWLSCWSHFWQETQLRFQGDRKQFYIVHSKHISPIYEKN